MTEIRQDRLKVRFIKPQGEISRRELFQLAIPRYEVVPFVQPRLCRGGQECGLCLASCPLEAIKIEDNDVTIDTSLCSGCGACVADCPHQAIDYPGFSLEQLNRKMEGLLLPEGHLAEPRIVALTCRNCWPASRKDKTVQLDWPSDVVSLEIPCLAMATPWLMLRAFDLGVQGLALLFSPARCSAGLDSCQWEEDIALVQELLERWHIEPERIRLFEFAGDDFQNLPRELDQFAREIAGLVPTPLKGTAPTLISRQGLMLPALLKGLDKKLGGSPKVVITAEKMPFGKLELDKSRCTGCGLCAVDCPTDALTIAAVNESSYQLQFRHDLCVACRRCVEGCPEQCLELKRILELEKVGTPPAVLLDDGMARCRECGGIIGPSAMIERLQSKLQAAGSPALQLELCTICKKKKLNLPGGNLKQVVR